MLTLTKPEYEHLTNSFTKLASIASDGRETVGIKTPGVNFEASSLLVRDIALSLGNITDDDFNKQALVKVPAGRKPLRAFEQYLKQQLFSLTMNILPEYDKRMAKTPNQVTKTKLGGYIVKLKTQIELVTALLRKIDKEPSR